MFIGKKINIKYIAFFYSISSCFIEILIFILPLIIFMFMFHSMSLSSGKSIFLIFLIFIGVTISNLLALTVSYFLSKFILPFIGMSKNSILSAEASNTIITFKLFFKNPIKTYHSMMVAIFFGMFFITIKDTNKYKQKIILLTARINEKIRTILTRILIPMLPLYVFGFCLKLGHDDIISNLLAKYGKIFFINIIIMIIYLFLLYFIGSGFNLKDTIKNIKIFLPAGLTGFSTMSSAATMPVTISCAEKATDDKNLSDFIIPITSNIHMIGNDLVVIIMANSLLLIFNMNLPSISEFFTFAFAIAVIRFSSAGIPSSGAIIISPLLKYYFGFSSEMISLATTIYILQDSFMTSVNVMGNGAFVLIVKKIYQKLNIKKY